VASSWCARCATDPVLAAITVVVVSTDASPARRKMLADLGVSGYLPKPFRPEELRQVLASTCSPRSREARRDAGAGGRGGHGGDRDPRGRGLRAGRRRGAGRAAGRRGGDHDRVPRPAVGTVRVWIDAAEARAFAVATLGCDDPEPAVVADAVRELTNMIAGHVLGRVWPDVCIALDGAALGAASPADAYAVHVTGDHGRIAVGMEVAS
jgi:hypothetical protein